MFASRVPLYGELHAYHVNVALYVSMPSWAVVTAEAMSLILRHDYASYCVQQRCRRR